MKYLEAVAQGAKSHQMMMNAKLADTPGINQDTSKVNNFVNKPLTNNVLNIKN